MQLGRNMQATIWGLVLLTFVLLGSIEMIARLLNHGSSVHGRWATSDHQLLEALKAPLSSQTLLAALDRLSTGDPILFVGPSSDPAFIGTYYLVNYFAWPRQVWVVACGEPGQEPSWTMSPSEFVRLGAVVHYSGQLFSWSSGDETLGSRLRVIPNLKEVKWTSFCP
jgi:hypothetical protein